jgi:hypothetical protein
MHPPEAHDLADRSDAAKHQRHCFDILHVNHVTMIAGRALKRSYNFSFILA